MDVLELLKGRRSIRKYKSTPVEEEKIQKFLEAAQWAPSASNKQPWEFMIIKNPDIRQKLAKLHPYGKFVTESPVVFIPITDPSIHAKYHQSDTALATLQFMIMAHAQGLGTCWAGVIKAPFEDEMRNLLGVPKNLHILALVAVGYADQDRESKRKQLFVHEERYLTN